MEWKSTLVNLETKSALHLVFNSDTTWKSWIIEVIRLVPDSRWSGRVLHLSQS